MPALPRKCAKCRERRMVAVTEQYGVTLEHDGRSYAISIPDLTLLKCEACNNRVLDDEAVDRLNAALRQAAGLLQPDEICRRRRELGLTQEQLAEELEVPEATLARWESGAQLQQRHSDLILRAYFELPAFRDYLRQRLPNKQEPPAANSEPLPLAGKHVSAASD